MCIVLRPEDRIDAVLNPFFEGFILIMTHEAAGGVHRTIRQSDVQSGAAFISFFRQNQGNIDVLRCVSLQLLVHARLTLEYRLSLVVLTQAVGVMLDQSWCRCVLAST